MNLLIEIDPAQWWFSKEVALIMHFFQIMTK